jgi:V/A-type H+-transporting ATPase subunit D
MARKYKLTRPELKRHRDALARFERYLPMLKLKQQQLQITLLEVEQARAELAAELDKAEGLFRPYQAVLSDYAGLDVRGLARPTEVQTTTANVAGVTIPVFQAAVFPPAAYSLFATPPWVDRALVDLRRISELRAQEEVLHRRYELLHRELIRIMQRVNLFEKVKIPEATEAIRVIRIHLGDEMTAAVGRAKIAKAKIGESGAFGEAEYEDVAPAPETEGL